MTGFFTAPRIAWGPGAIEQLSGLGAHRALVVVDANVGRRGGERRVVEELAKSDTHVEVVAAPDAPDRIENVLRLKERIVAYAPDWVVAVGGGRTIDASKAARLGSERPDLAVEQLSPVHDFPDPPAPASSPCPRLAGAARKRVGPPTSWGRTELRSRSRTAGWSRTGRLWTPAWRRASPPTWSPMGPSKRSVLRPRRTSRPGRTRSRTPWPSTSAATVVRRLPHALRWSDDPDAKAALHYAATAAGLAASNAQRGVAHALSRALEEPTGLSYGRLMAIVLPLAVEFDHPSARERLEALSFTVSAPEDNGRTPTPMPVRLRRLCDLAHIPATLRASGIVAGRVESSRDAIVARTLRSPAVLANPRVPTREDILSLVHAALGLPEVSGR